MMMLFTTYHWPDFANVLLMLVLICYAAQGTRHNVQCADFAMLLSPVAVFACMVALWQPLSNLFLYIRILKKILQNGQLPIERLHCHVPCVVHL